VSQAPVNLALRFLLKPAVWGAMGHWGAPLILHNALSYDRILAFL
jgi:hypothetical protein